MGHDTKLLRNIIYALINNSVLNRPLQSAQALSAIRYVPVNPSFFSLTNLAGRIHLCDTGFITTLIPVKSLYLSVDFDTTSDMPL